MSTAFHGIDELVVTFAAGTVTAGYPAAMSGNKTVRNAGNGVAPVGITLNKRSGFGAVQIRGYAEVTYSGTAPSLGWNTMVADGSGGLRVANDGEKGRSCLVVDLNTTNKIAGLFL